MGGRKTRLLYHFHYFSIFHLDFRQEFRQLCQLLIKLFFFCAALRQLGPIFVGDSRGPAGTGGGVGPAPPPRHENDLLGGDSLPNLRERQLLGPSHVTPPARRAPELSDCAPDLGGRAPNIPSLSSYGATTPVSWRAAPPRGCATPSAKLGSTPIQWDGRSVP